MQRVMRTQVTSQERNKADAENERCLTGHLVKPRCDQNTSINQFKGDKVSLRLQLGSFPPFILGKQGSIHNSRRMWQRSLIS